jgi:hypothetical protein
VLDLLRGDVLAAEEGEPVEESVVDVAAVPADGAAAASERDGAEDASVAVGGDQAGDSDIHLRESMHFDVAPDELAGEIHMALAGEVADEHGGDKVRHASVDFHFAPHDLADVIHAELAEEIAEKHAPIHKHDSHTFDVAPHDLSDEIHAHLAGEVADEHGPGPHRHASVGFGVAPDDLVDAIHTELAEEVADEHSGDKVRHTSVDFHFAPHDLADAIHAELADEVAAEHAVVDADALDPEERSLSRTELLAEIATLEGVAQETAGGDAVIQDAPIERSLTREELQAEIATLEVAAAEEGDEEADVSNVGTVTTAPGSPPMTPPLASRLHLFTNRVADPADDAADEPSTTATTGGKPSSPSRTTTLAKAKKVKAKKVAEVESKDAGTIAKLEKELAAVVKQRAAFKASAATMQQELEDLRAVAVQVDGLKNQLVAAQVQASGAAEAAPLPGNDDAAAAALAALAAAHESDLADAQAEIDTLKAAASVVESTYQAQFAELDRAFQLQLAGVKAQLLAAEATATASGIELTSLVASHQNEVQTLSEQLGAASASFEAAGTEASARTQTAEDAMRAELEAAVETAAKATELALRNEIGQLTAALSKARSEPAASVDDAEYVAKATAWAQQVFEAADKNNDGTLSKTEIKKYFKLNADVKMVLLGVDFHWKDFFNGMDEDGNGSFDIGEFTLMAIAACERQFAPTIEENSGAITEAAASQELEALKSELQSSQTAVNAAFSDYEAVREELTTMELRLEATELELTDAKSEAKLASTLAEEWREASNTLEVASEAAAKMASAATIEADDRTTTLQEQLRALTSELEGTSITMQGMSSIQEQNDALQEQLTAITLELTTTKSTLEAATAASAASISDTADATVVLQARVTELTAEVAAATEQSEHWQSQAAIGVQWQTTAQQYQEQLTGVKETLETTETDLSTANEALTTERATFAAERTDAASASTAAIEVAIAAAVDEADANVVVLRDQIESTEAKFNAAKLALYDAEKAGGDVATVSAERDELRAALTESESQRDALQLSQEQLAVAAAEAVATGRATGEENVTLQQKLSEAESELDNLKVFSAEAMEAADVAASEAARLSEDANVALEQQLAISTSTAAESASDYQKLIVVGAMQAAAEAELHQQLAASVAELSTVKHALGTASASQEQVAELSQTLSKTEADREDAAASLQGLVVAMSEASSGLRDSEAVNTTLKAEIEELKSHLEAASENLLAVENKDADVAASAAFQAADLHAKMAELAASNADLQQQAAAANEQVERHVEAASVAAAAATESAADYQKLIVAGAMQATAEAQLKQQLAVAATELGSLKTALETTEADADAALEDARAELAEAHVELAQAQEATSVTLSSVDDEADSADAALPETADEEAECDGEQYEVATMASKRAEFEVTLAYVDRGASFGVVVARTGVKSGMSAGGTLVVLEVHSYTTASYAPEVGDEILEVNGIQVTTVEEADAVTNGKSGDSVQVKFARVFSMAAKTATTDTPTTSVEASEAAVSADAAASATLQTSLDQVTHELESVVQQLALAQTEASGALARAAGAVDAEVTKQEADALQKELAEVKQELYLLAEDTQNRADDLEMELSASEAAGNELRSQVKQLADENGELTQTLTAARDAGLAAEKELAASKAIADTMENDIEGLKSEATAAFLGVQPLPAATMQESMASANQQLEAKNKKLSKIVAVLEEKHALVKKDRAEYRARMQKLQTATLAQFEQLRSLAAEQTERHAVEVNMLEDQFKRSERQVVSNAVAQKLEKKEEDIHKLRVALSRKDLALSNKIAELNRLNKKLATSGGGNKSSDAPTSPTHNSNSSKGWTTGFHHTHTGSPGFGPPPALPLGRCARSPSPIKMGAPVALPIWQRQPPTGIKSPAAVYPAGEKVWKTGFQNHNEVGTPTFPSPAEGRVHGRQMVVSPGGLAYVA